MPFCFFILTTRLVYFTDITLGKSVIDAGLEMVRVQGRLWLKL